MDHWIRTLWNRLQARLRGARFLCDVCRYNYREACRRPERPNATACPEFRCR